MRKSPCLTALALAFFLLAIAARAQPVDRSELDALRAQVRRLEEQLRVITRQLSAHNGTEDPARITPAPASLPPVVTASDQGFSITSADAQNVLRLRALLHVDSRVFFDDGGIVNNTFTLRRARLISEGRIAGQHSYQFVTEFGGTSVSIVDANFTVAFTDQLQLKMGKFKTPIGLEVLQSDAATSFAERSMLAGFLPNRDLGIQLGGTLASGHVNYTAGIFNGIANGVNSTNVDFDEGKDAVARVMVAPFARASQLGGLSFGVGGGVGQRKSAAGRETGYRSDGQQLFFVYQPLVTADGYAWRLSPQFDYRAGPLGLMGEYVVSASNLRASPLSPVRELRHRGWQMTAGYVLTGENSDYAPIVPRNDFNPRAGTWGAFQILGRYTDVRMDDASFPTFASPLNSAREARSYGLGLTWYLSKAVLFKFDYYQTDFTVAPLPLNLLTPVLRQDEKVFVSRFQLAF